MQIAILRRAKAQLSSLLEGPLVRLGLMQPDMQPRQGGQLKGRIWIADDFDEFDDELEQMFLGPVGPEE